MKVETNSNARTAQADSKSLNSVLKVAFSAGAIMGLIVVSFALFDLSVCQWPPGSIYLKEHFQNGGFGKKRGRPNPNCARICPASDCLKYHGLGTRSTHRNRNLKKGGPAKIRRNSRSGLYYTTTSTYFTANQIEYIIKDCGAKVFFTSYAALEVPIVRLHARCFASKAPKQMHTDQCFPMRWLFIPREWIRLFISLYINLRWNKEGNYFLLASMLWRSNKKWIGKNDRYCAD